MSREDVKKAYQQRIESLDHALKSVNSRYNLFAYGRMGFFVLGAALTYWLFTFDFLLGLVGGVVALVLFLYIIKLHTQLAEHREHQNKLREINQQELEALDGNYSQLDNGKDLIDTAHYYSYDLDIFGKASIFQFINRTGTTIGRQRLANELMYPRQAPEVILANQEAIQELAAKIDWNLNFQTLGKGKVESEDDPASIINWLKEPAYYSTHKLYPFLIYLMPALFALAFLGWVVPDIPPLREALSDIQLPGIVPLFFFLLNLGIIGNELKRTSLQQVQLGRKSGMLNKYASLLSEIEAVDFQSSQLQHEQQQLKTQGKTAGEAISRLGELTYMLDQRLNAVAGFILNGIMLWDFVYMIKLEKWRAEYKEQLPIWFDIISYWDARVSFARYTYNHPEYVFPQVKDGPFFLNAKQLGHPLIDPETRVDNDMNLGKPGEFLIITGANMAGKSTFLRTVGVNLILAMNGAPVCAQSYEFVPIPLMTSVRATDSLEDHESYFYAELKRLKMLIDKLKEGKPIFIIVDEMLRGTNSRDKQVGSRKFIEQLIQLKGTGMIATHDLSLGTLAEDYPEFARNKRFEVDITDNQLTFDYTLRDGISQNLNATFLMQQMGIMP